MRKILYFLAVIMNLMLKDILKSQKVYLERKVKTTKIVERERNIPRTKLIKVITGVRRCGKSFFTYLCLKNKKFAYANFDDERLLNYRPEDIIKALIELYGDFNIIFLDEVQNLEKWEIFVNRLYREGYDLYITGSNAKLLSKELATYLTGRSVSIELFPFSFREFLKSKDFRVKTDRDIPRLKRYLEEYIKIGGFPEVVVENEDPVIYLSELFNQITTKDIILRYNIRYKKTLKDISFCLLSNISSYITYNSIKKNFGLRSEHTAKNYLNYLEESYLFIFLDRFSYRPKEMQKSPKKIYVIDTGFFNALGFRFSENIGRLIENIVAIELLRRKYYYNSYLEIYYYKTKNHKEIDFLVKESNSIKQLINITYANSFGEIDKREWISLLEGYYEFKNFGHDPELIVITWDYEDERELKWFGRRGKIKFIPLWKWLLNISL